MSILRFILETQREREVSPSIREICEHLGGRNVKTVAEHLDRLEEKGAIERERGVVRSIRVVDPDLTEDAGQVKLVGRIAAGVPIEAIEMPETLDILPTLGLLPGREMFALQVRGDSMIEDRIHDGDYVIVEKCSTARNGQTVVAILEDEEATLKRFYREDGRVRLQPANSSMEPIYPEQVEIRGVVRSVLRVTR
jgi:repressor LexA